LTLLTVAILKVLHPTSPQAIERLGRQYVLILADAPYWITVYRSGAERPMTIHGEAFPSYDDMLRDAREKLARRFQHGYSLVWWQEDFPLLDWIKAHHYAQAWDANLSAPPLQLHLPFSA
jgi:hypothetical protein